MSPEERQLLSELFERVRTQANAPRDRDAENFIAEAMRALPYAPYFLAQATIMQDQALRAADQKIAGIAGRNRPTSAADAIGRAGRGRVSGRPVRRRATGASASARRHSFPLGRAAAAAGL